MSHHSLTFDFSPSLSIPLVTLTICQFYLSVLVILLLFVILFFFHFLSNLYNYHNSFYSIQLVNELRKVKRGQKDLTVNSRLGMRFSPAHRVGLQLGLG